MEVLAEKFGNDGTEIFIRCELIQYLNIKTVSANRGSKSRGSFGNLYAVYVLIEDYINKGFDEAREDYSKYEGANFSDLFQRQRELPFGAKLQNHALNHRLNKEYIKYFPISNVEPIIRDTGTRKYWIKEDLLLITVNNTQYNVAVAIIEIIDKYIETKLSSFNSFIEKCKKMMEIPSTDSSIVKSFINSLLGINVDARLFEIASFAILKEYYRGYKIYWGWTLEELEEEYLTLYKTGRTNANDGGIDFVMKPLGRFFQVTETMDVKKYFLDIDKIHRYPITFVIKSDDSTDAITRRIEDAARSHFGIDAIVAKYMEAVEEIINIPILKECLDEVAEKENISELLKEIITQSTVEFNIQESSEGEILIDDDE